MKTLLNPWFILGCLTWLALFAARISGHPLAYINGHLTDVFAVPVIANLALWLLRVFIIKSNYYVLSPAQVAFLIGYLSLLFEGLLPMISKIYTADWADVVLYVFGGLFFYKVMNKPLRISTKVSKVRKSERN